MMAEFESSVRNEDCSQGPDGAEFEAVTVFATPEECRTLMAKVMEMVEPFMKRRSDDQDMHTVAFVTTPPFRLGEADRRRDAV